VLKVFQVVHHKVLRDQEVHKEDRELKDLLEQQEPKVVEVDKELRVR
jgi:hypothetical protein